MAQMTAYRDSLLREQSDLQAEIDKLTDAMEALGSGGGRGAAGRGMRVAARGKGKGGVRPGSLKSYILKVMRPGQVMAVKDVAVLVRKRGYRTGSHNFANQVSNAMAQMPQLTKISRGKFRA
jgi:hypothetical protein